MNANQIDQEFAACLPEGDAAGSFLTNLVGVALADFDCTLEAGEWQHEGAKNANIKSRVVSITVEFWGMVATVNVAQVIDRRPRKNRVTGASIVEIIADDLSCFRSATGLFC